MYSYLYQCENVKKWSASFGYGVVAWGTRKLLYCDKSSTERWTYIYITASVKRHLFGNRFKYGRWGLLSWHCLFQSLCLSCAWNFNGSRIFQSICLVSTFSVKKNPHVWRRWRKINIDEENIKVRVKYYFII